MKIDFVLARYKENITKNFLNSVIKNRIKQNTEFEIFIYDKHSQKEDTYKLLENIGRENFAWCTHIIETWNNPPDYYAFIHPCGPEKDQRPEKFDFVLKMIDDYNNMILENRNFGPIIDKNNVRLNTWDIFFSLKKGWIGNTTCNMDDVRKQKYTPTRYKTMAEWWLNITKINKFPNQRSLCGMCIVSSKSIQSWGVNFWEKILEQVVEGGANGEISHFLERSMYAFAKGKK